MCGIAGIHGLEAFDGLAGATRGVCDMVSALAHRGPDAEGVWSNEEHVVLGHRRLSILDTGEGANQPFLMRRTRWCSTVEFTIIWSCAANWRRQAPIGFPPAETRRWCYGLEALGLTVRSVGSTACSHSHGGRPPNVVWHWSETAWASSRCIGTKPRRARWCLLQKCAH